MRHLAILLLLVTIPTAAAHPFTEQTIPSLASNPPAGIDHVIVYYSEPVDIGFSELRVLDNSGNQIDNGDTTYYEGETSLIITTTPLEDGVYTVSSKVLSKIDGHLVPDAFLFAVGGAIADPSQLEEQDVELIFLPEAGARIPGMVGQTIILGAIISSILVWRGPMRSILQETMRIHHSKFMAVAGVGIILVLVSDIMMIAVQAVRLGAPLLDTIGTYFGTVWLARLVITILLLAMWFILDKRELTIRSRIPMLAAALALISTTSLIGHGAASGHTAALILDYIHNLVAAAWIGGIFYLLFAALPTVSKSGDKACLAIIPRFSAIFTISLGVVIVTGPTLLWFIETDINLITESLYGQLIILKVILAGIMVGTGFIIQTRTRNTQKPVHKMLRRSLRTDAILGVILLGIVALLANGTLPAGQIQSADAIPRAYQTTEFTSEARFDIEIVPFAAGPNTIQVTISDPGGTPLYDTENVKVKISNPSRGISSIETAMVQDGATYTGKTVFGFSGMWQLEIEAQRTENPNESKIIQLDVRPALAGLQIDIEWHELPEPAMPLHPIYYDNMIWLSDPSAPRIWQFSPDTQQFTPYEFDGITTTFLTADSTGNIWFVDTPGNQIGYLDADKITTISIPKLDPLMSQNIPISILADDNDMIWIVVTNKDRIIRYDPGTGIFDEVRLDRGSLPFAIAVGPDQNIWYTASGTGNIGYIDPGTLQNTEIEAGLEGPEALLFDRDGYLWIAEHTGTAISRYDHALNTFSRIIVPNMESLPFGMAQDRYGNIWFAQHVIDTIAVYDPARGDLIEKPIPYESSFVQFLTSDEDTIWMVAQNANALGMAHISELPTPIQFPTPEPPRYSEIISPLMAAGIIAASLFLVRTMGDWRRADAGLGPA